jgi:DNA-binding CsgD family transcriptional regulator/PAS domain-containing protein
MSGDILSADMERLSDLIGAIYDCVLDPGRWEATLDEIRRLLDCANCMLSVVDLRTGALRIQKMIGIDPAWAARIPDYAPDLVRLYLQVPDFHTRPIDHPFSPWRDVGGAALRTCRYYQEWAKPQGLIDAIGVHLIRSPDRMAELGLGRAERAGIIGEREHHLLRLLAPHLRRALTISDLIDMKSLEAEGLAGALDALTVGILLVGEDGVILHANRTAARMLDRRTPIAAAQGRLRANDRHATDRLRRAVALAAGDEPQIAAAGIGIALRGSTGEVATAHVLPLGSGEVRTRLLPRAVAAVFIASGLQLPFGRLEAVAEAFGLTPAETRLLDRLIRGESIADAAAAMNVAVTTAKTHRSRLLSKTGMRRQTGLISLVHRLVPAIRAAEVPPAEESN